MNVSDALLISLLSYGEVLAFLRLLKEQNSSLLTGRLIFIVFLEVCTYTAWNITQREDVHLPFYRRGFQRTLFLSLEAYLLQTLYFFVLSLCDPVWPWLNYISQNKWNLGWIREDEVRPAIIQQFPLFLVKMLCYIQGLYTPILPAKFCLLHLSENVNLHFLNWKFSICHTRLLACITWQVLY